MPIWLSLVIGLLKDLYAVESDKIKQHIIDELKALAVTEKDQPLIVAAIAMAEAAIAALPDSVPG